MGFTLSSTVTNRAGRCGPAWSSLTQTGLWLGSGLDSGSGLEPGSGLGSGTGSGLDSGMETGMAQDWTREPAWGSA